MPYIIIAIIVVMLLMLVVFFSRYKKCPSDKIMVIYGNIGKTKDGASSICLHGGAAFIYPFIQAYAF